MKQRSIKLLNICQPQGWWLVFDSLIFKSFIKDLTTIELHMSSEMLKCFCGRDFIGHIVISKPEPKAQVSFSDRNLSDRNFIEICLIENL